jgi:polyisoprenoid-binding protein YceI
MRTRLSFLLAFLTCASAQDIPIDTQKSTITIHAGKAGLMSAAGHDHWVSAPIASGTIRESGTLHVEFKVAAAKMAVKPDPKVDEKTRAQIQKDMEEMTLETLKYPEISFASSRIEKTGDGQWKVEGALTLHGVSKQVTVVVKSTGGAYTGHAVLKQTDFGIKPVTVGGGLVKVKNEIDIDFQIYGRTA